MRSILNLTWRPPRQLIGSFGIDLATIWVAGSGSGGLRPSAPLLPGGLRPSDPLHSVGPAPRTPKGAPRALLQRLVSRVQTMFHVRLLAFMPNHRLCRVRWSTRRRGAIKNSRGHSNIPQANGPSIVMNRPWHGAWLSMQGS